MENKRYESLTSNGDSRGNSGAKVVKRKGFHKRKVCRFCMTPAITIDYKDAKMLRYFITERGKIIPKRISGCCARHQRTLTHAIKRARTIALLPFVGSIDQG